VRQHGQKLVAPLHRLVRPLLGALLIGHVAGDDDDADDVAYPLRDWRPSASALDPLRA
jgi:hypothetical protein